MASIWDSQELIGEYKKNGKGDVIRVTHCVKGTNNYIDIRNYFEDDSGELQPTKKGVAIPVDLVAQILEDITESINEI